MLAAASGSGHRTPNAMATTNIKTAKMVHIPMIWGARRTTRVTGSVLPDMGYRPARSSLIRVSARTISAVTVR